MKAVILIGGFGTRLEPLTITRPKTMVPVLNQPFLEYLIVRLRNSGVSTVVLSLGYLPKPIQDYFGDGSAWGIKIEYAVEDQPLGTGGGIKNAAAFLDETFLVVNGDVFTDIDIQKMQIFHLGTNALVTIAMIPVEDTSRFGVIETDLDYKVTRFLEKPVPGTTDSKNINAGFIIMDPSVLQRIPENTPFSYERQLLPHMVNEGEPVFGYASDAYWIDIGTPEKYFSLNADLLERKSIQYQPGHESKLCIHPEAVIDNSAIVKGTVVLGKGVSVGPGADISNSIIWEGVTIGKDVKIHSSLIADNCSISDGCCVNDSVLGSNVFLGEKRQIFAGSRVYPGSELR